MPSTRELLHSIKQRITQKNERAYFWTHEERYRIVLEEIKRISVSARQRVSAITPIRRHTDPSDTSDTLTPLKILDVGCFPYHIPAALELLGHEVWGISSQHEPIKNKKIAVINIEKDTFPYKKDYFDIIICTEVLEHLPHSPLLALKEMHRVLKPGGRLLVTTPNIARSINRGKLILGKSVMYPLDDLLVAEGAGTNIYHRHNREYTMRELTRLMNVAGFDIARRDIVISYTPFRRRPTPDPWWLWTGKYLNYLVMTLIPSLRDTLLVVGGK